MPSYLPGLNFPIYSGWTQYTPVIPKMYWDVFSAEQRMKNLCMNFDKVEHYLDYIAEQMNNWNIEFSKEIKAEFEAMWKAIHDEYEMQIHGWIERDGEKIFKDIFSNVFFGINEQGYFVAYVPESWNELQFDTGMVYGEDTYGRLIMRWDVDNSSESVNQRPEEWR